jgi:hypothetical protein
VLDGSNNTKLHDLRGIVGAANLEKLHARACDLRTVEKLGSCQRLFESDVSLNPQLEDLC